MALPELETVFVFAEPAASEQRLAELAAKPEVMADAAYYCELLTRLARCRGLQRRFEEAHRTLDSAEATLCESPACQVRIPLERGRVLNSSGDKASARAHFLKAFELAMSSGLDALAIDAAHMLAIATTGDESLAWNERALELTERTADPAAKKWFGPLYNNTGWTHHDSGNYELALERFQKALAWRTEQGQANEVRIARWCVARCLRSMGRLEEALKVQLDLSASDSDGYVDEELGELKLAMGDPQGAAGHFSAAYEKLSKDPWLEANERARLERILDLSRA